MAAKKLTTTTTDADIVDRARALVQDGNTAPDCRALEAYASWLFYERRLLCLELFPGLGPDAERFVLTNAAADDFHFGAGGPAWNERPQPSTRAATVLDLVGVNWRDARGPKSDFLPDEVRDPANAPALRAGWPQVDAELIALEKAWREAEAARKDAERRWLEASAKVGDLPLPEGLLWRDSDRDLGLYGGAQHRSGAAYYYLGAVERLRSKPRLREVRHEVTDEIRARHGLPDDAHTLVSYEPWPEAQARADEIVAAHDEWVAERAAREEAERVPEYDEEADAIIAMVESLREEIARTPARTVEGMAVKARLAAAMMSPERREQLERDGFLYDLRDAEPAELMTSLVRDLVNLSRPVRSKT